MNFGSPRADRFPYANLKAKKDHNEHVLLRKLNFISMGDSFFFDYQVELTIFTVLLEHFSSMILRNYLLLSDD